MFHSATLCREAGCADLARRSGFCDPHYRRHASPPTSDGKKGSGKKLSPEQVAEARRMYACLGKKRDIARHFGVDTKTLNRAMEQSK